MNIGWLISLILWGVFMVIWAYYGLVKHDWRKALFFVCIALIFSVASLVFASL